MPRLEIETPLTKKSFFFRLFPAVPIILIGTSLTIFLYFQSVQKENEALQRRLTKSVNTHLRALDDTLKLKLSKLRAMETLFTHSDEVTLLEFEGASELLLNSVNSVRAFQWVPIVAHSEKEAFEQKAAATVHPDFQIREPSSLIDHSTGLNDAEYYPIYYNHPINENIEALGINIKNQRQELQTAIREEVPVTSDRLVLAQEPDRADGWILTIPVYPKGRLQSEPKQESNCPPIGFVQLVLHLDEFLFMAFREIDESDSLHIEISDLKDGGDVVSWWASDNSSSIQQSALKIVVDFPVFQRTWQMTFRPTRTLVLSTQSHAPIFTLLFGGALTALLGAFIYHLMQIRYTVELQVQERTQDLRAANAQLNEEISQRRTSDQARIELEERLQHSQKMEAMGTLAGGIAHDFNNILAAILGYIELLKEEIIQKHGSDSSIEEIEKACFRARDLVKQILIFSRQDAEARQLVNPAPLVRDAVKLIRATIPAAIGIKSDIDAEVSPILADSSQIHQIALNLITNASHAVGTKGGTIEVRLNDVAFDSPQESIDGEIPVGRYVCLKVQDNGIGIEEATLQRIFEPYFTTKEKGHGSGMGLSMVHGIVRNHQGYISVRSTPGVGTTFNVFIPAQESTTKTEQSTNKVGINGKQQLVVVVDDEEPITSLIEINLSKQQFQVRPFTDSAQCLRYLNTTEEKIDLVITDFAMPKADGMEILSAVRELDSKIPVILYTGRISEEEQLEFKDSGISAILSKPVSFSEMNQCISKLLETKS